MTEHRKAVTWGQFGAAIDMLGDALSACPDELWQTRLYVERAGPAGFAEFWSAQHGIRLPTPAVRFCVLLGVASAVVAASLGWSTAAWALDGAWTSISCASVCW